MPQFLTTDEIRRRWVAFFVSKGHKHVPSDSLVPANDPSVLFTGAGMNQFKDHFLGRAKLDHPHQRAVTVQKCVRASDIDNVGRTPNHHTFFEMLGNFSFGDYFKKEAIAWAAEFLLDPKAGLGLEPERLSVTVFSGNPELHIEPDREAIACWKQYAPWLKDPRAKDGVEPGWRIYAYGEGDNFWPANAPSQGPNGPCGPCSEIYYDTQPDGTPRPVAEDSERFCEIWNLVFTGYNRMDVGKIAPLPAPNIDTGAGLERMTRVIQGKPSNFEIDLLFPIVQTVAKIAKKEYGKDFETDRRLRRITDHVRTATFAIADGAQPKNEGRNYVIRRLMRRAILDGQELGIEGLFLGQVAKAVIRQMKVGYPELEPRQETLVRLIEEEEKAFSRTLKDGEGLLEVQIIDELCARVSEDPSGKLAAILPVTARLLRESEARFDRSDDGRFVCVSKVIPAMEHPRQTMTRECLSKKAEIAQANHGVKLDGRFAFLLWDTFGFPYELTSEQCGELGIEVDRKAFERCVEVARDRSRAESDIAKDIFAGGPVAELKKQYAGHATGFTGYEGLELQSAKVLAIIHGDHLVPTADRGTATVLLDKTPFYGESGGQVGDRGILTSAGGTHEVLDAQKQEGLVLHRVQLAGPLKVGEHVVAGVHPSHRLPVMKNHSATHLLHLALRETLGSHVEQRGSLVSPDRLRFDFTHFEAITDEQLRKIEARVNELIQQNHPVATAVTTPAEARAAGAMALFGEKYGEKVRMVHMGPSRELCGGTHCQQTGQIGYFRIVSESSIAAGVRRIEALTGAAAVSDAQEADATLDALAAELKTKREDLATRVAALQDELAALKRERESMQKKAANATAGELLSQVKDVAGAKLLAAAVEGADPAGLRTTLDGIRKNLPEAAVVLAGVKEGKVALLVSMSPDVVKRGGHAGNLLKQLAPLVGGKGGGKPEMAQGGGTDAAKVPAALAAAAELLAKMMK